VRPGGWSQTIRPFSLPYGMDVVLGDVCGGSNFPAKVRLAACSWRLQNAVLLCDVQYNRNPNILYCGGCVGGGRCFISFKLCVFYFSAALQTLG
jgi:hypothetical protein